MRGVERKGGGRKGEARKRRGKGRRGERRGEESRAAYSQFFSFGPVRQPDLYVGQISPVRAWGLGNVLHAGMDQGTHLLTDVVTKDWLVLVATDLKIKHGKHE